ncbi:MAG: FeoB-associated Cys-rich membrane protein [Candidatus Electronema sp. V4]|uniref:FeoB-associated Cys-rich membrane protein n=1 Tax=Candidatus Electronema sp. V4 TaxID=3454756 RepID=UPI0040553E5F
MQTAVVVLIVLLACVFVGWRLFQSFRSGSSCGGCSDCGKGSCSGEKNADKEEDQ